MRKILLATTAVALALALPVAGNALSLSVSVGAGASANGDASGSGLNLGSAANLNAGAQANSDNSAGGTGTADGSATAAANGNVSTNSVLSAFNDNDQAAIQAIGNPGADSKVQVVRIGSMVSANADSFNQAIANTSNTSAQLQTAINGNTDLSAQLGQNNVDVSTIVAADVDADGTLVLYSNS